MAFTQKLIRVRCLIVCVIVLLLSGCQQQGNRVVPVADRSSGLNQSSQSAPERYVVQKGDTLYSIAWRYGLDFRTIARANNIDSQYRIYPGQSLRLRAVTPSVNAPVLTTAQKKTTSQTVVTRVKQESTQSVNVSPVIKPVINTEVSSNTSVTRNSVAQNVTSTAVQVPGRTEQPAIEESTKPGSYSVRKKSAIVGNVRWQWPTDGQVIEPFRTRGRINKGINISGRESDPVYAAASGEVVYAGSGLLGYGNLIIVNHNGLYMSAYAHNNRIFVKEQDRVSRGDRIAEVGNSGTDRFMLHFEIRRDGKPVNPLKYLPKR